MRSYFGCKIMQWTDRIRQVKILLVLSAVVIGAASLIISHYLVRDLEIEEKRKMEVWAEAMRSLSEADETTDMALVLSVIESNNTIPVIVMNQDSTVQIYRNLLLRYSTPEDSINKLYAAVNQMSRQHHVIPLSLGEGEYVCVYYDDSLLLRRLEWWPYVQLGIVLIFVVVAIFALMSSQKAEQNKVWVGLSKETAHQLGTPISSLMAWVEVLRETYPDDTLIPEIDKDVKRLQLIAERFSKIGSLPEPREEDLCKVVAHVVEYIGRRASNRVSISVSVPDGPLPALLSASLFEWVIENLCKNAIDAMNGEGKIHIMARQEEYCLAIEVSDTGKGIPSKHFKTVFTPGFTTKSRGWGLGLSLARRIVEEYHHGRIFVKQSELGRGTTFRIELPLFEPSKTQ